MHYRLVQILFGFKRKKVSVHHFLRLFSLSQRSASEHQPSVGRKAEQPFRFHWTAQGLYAILQTILYRTHIAETAMQTLSIVKKPFSCVRRTQIKKWMLLIYSARLRRLHKKTVRYIWICLFSPLLLYHTSCDKSNPSSNSQKTFHTGIVIRTPRCAHRSNYPVFFKHRTVFSAAVLTSSVTMEHKSCMSSSQGYCIPQRSHRKLSIDILTDIVTYHLFIL